MRTRHGYMHVCNNAAEVTRTVYVHAFIYFCQNIKVYVKKDKRKIIMHNQIFKNYIQHTRRTFNSFRNNEKKKKEQKRKEIKKLQHWKSNSVEKGNENLVFELKSRFTSRHEGA